MSTTLCINPFSNVHVKRPREIENAISGLNDKQLDRLLNSFGSLNSTPQKQLGRAVFLSSPQPGYGKSHLLGRLFQNLSTKATLVYVLPFQDPESCWTSILLRTVQELSFPDRANNNDLQTDSITQLETIAHGIFVDLISQGIQIERLQPKKSQPQNSTDIINYLKGLTLKEFRETENYKVVKKCFKGLCDVCETINDPFNTSTISWLNVLYICAYEPSNPLKQSCLDWLKGNSIDEDEAKKIGIRVADFVPIDSSTAYKNDLCKNRLTDLCRLTLPVRPFVFSFDETEVYLLSDAHAVTFGTVIQTLVKAIPNHMTVITANVTPWKIMRKHWQDAQIDCLSPAIELEGISKEQGKSLIEERLKQWDFGLGHSEKMLEDGWLESVFNNISQMGIRRFIGKSHLRWDEVANISKPIIDIETRLKEYYLTIIEKIESDTHRSVYDVNALMWLVQDLAAGLPGLCVKPYKCPKDYFQIKWEINNQHYYFGFEDGNHHKRWQAIKSQSEKLFNSAEQAKSVFLRTPDLKNIPGNWISAPEINKAKQQYLQISSLDFKMTCRIYAAKDMFNETVCGDISFADIDSVCDFLRNQLQDFWRSLTGPIDVDKENKPISGVNITHPSELIEKITSIVAKEKLMAFTELFDMVKNQWPDVALVRSVFSMIPEIKQYHAPNMTVLKWMSTKSM